MKLERRIIKRMLPKKTVPLTAVLLATLISGVYAGARLSNTLTASWNLIGARDIAIISVYSFKTVVGQGYNLNINVTAMNHGDITETFNVTAYANNTSIQEQTATLGSGDSATLTFTWNTSGYAKGNYTISANTTIFPEDINATDNILEDGTVMVSVPGDINGDRIVNLYDLFSMGKAYNSTPNNFNWNPNADINNDEMVNALDLTIFSENYGRT